MGQKTNNRIVCKNPGAATTIVVVGTAVTMTAAAGAAAMDGRSG